MCSFIVRYPKAGASVYCGHISSVFFFLFCSFFFFNKLPICVHRYMYYNPVLYWRTNLIKVLTALGGPLSQSVDREYGPE